MPATRVARPRLPRFLGLPMGLVPERLNGLVAAEILTRVFARERQGGELDFLTGRVVRIRVLDAGSSFAVRLERNGFRAVTAQAADLTISGTLYDFLLLVTGREDPDTLFFQRHLRMEGSTALGVHLKNFLAAVDPTSLPLAQFINPALRQGLALYERVT